MSQAELAKQTQAPQGNEMRFRKHFLLILILRVTVGSLFAGVFLCSCAPSLIGSKACGLPQFTDTTQVLYRGEFLSESNSMRYKYFGHNYSDSGKIRRKYYDRQCKLIYDVGVTSLSSDTLDGKFLMFYPTGEKKYVGDFQRNYQIGKHYEYHTKGTITYEFVLDSAPWMGHEKFFSKKGELIAEGRTFKNNRAGLWRIRRQSSFWGYEFEDVFYDTWELESNPKYNSNQFLKEKLGIDKCFESEHFIYYCAPNELKSAKLCDKVLFERFAALTEGLRFTPKKKIQLNLFTNRRDFRRFGVNLGLGTVGVCLNQGKIIVLTNKNLAVQKLFFKKMVVHETVHAFIAGIHGDSTSIPRWLNEGLAEFFANNPRLSIAKIKRAVGGETITSIPELNMAFMSTKNNELAYSASYYLVRFLVNEYGMEKINQFIRNPNQFEAIFAFPYPELWSRFRVNLRNEKMSLLEILQN